MINGFQLLNYQDASVNEIDDFDGRALVALDPGLGKTAISLEWIQRLPEVRMPALVVCPAAVKYHWRWEAAHFFGIQASVCEGQTPPNDYGEFRIHSNLTIINYDILMYWVQYLKKQKFRTVILDECQMLGDPSTKRTKAAKEVTSRVPFVLPLSATPLTIRPIQLWPVLNMLWKESFPNKSSFAHEFCNPKWTPWGWDFTGASNINELHRRLKVNGLVRYRKKDVLKDLPDKVRRITLIEPRNPDEYKLASSDFMTWLKQNMAHRIQSASKAEELAKVGYLLRLIARLKLKGVVDWANNFLQNSDEKLVLFAIHTQAIEVLKRRIEHKSVVVNGAVVGEKRQLAVDQFQKDPETRCFIGQMQAAGVGINLNAATEVGIVEYPWRPGDLTQAEDRPHRIGQKNTVFVNYFAAAGTIEVDLCELLEERGKVIANVLDGGSQFSDLNLHTELLKKIEGSFV